MGKDSATPYNGRIDGEKNSDNKSNLKDVGLMGNCGPIFKENGRLILEPSKPSTSLKEKLHDIKKPASSLGIRVILAGQARGVLDFFDPDLAAHHPFVAAGKGDGLGLGFEEEGSKNQSVLEDTRRDRTAVSLDVGNLDSGRHSAVVFHGSTQNKDNNNAHPSNNFDSSLVLPSGSGKAFKNRGRGFVKK
ncbi:hypothetical protein GOBAR_DD08894 [Gossypium barbadense]|nr:hypothetical protein GOBAR_DD08894 [Gossypium barbadense]